MGGCCSKPPPSGVPIRVPPIKLMRGAPMEIETSSGPISVQVPEGGKMYSTHLPETVEPLPMHNPGQPVTVFVPQGVGSGQAFVHHGPFASYALTCPKPYPPGGYFQWNLPGAPMTVQSPALQVKVPPGVNAGEPFVMQLPDGRSHTVHCPTPYPSGGYFFLKSGDSPPPFSLLVPPNVYAGDYYKAELPDGRTATVKCPTPYPHGNRFHYQPPPLSMTPPMSTRPSQSPMSVVQAVPMDTTPVVNASPLGTTPTAPIAPVVAQPVMAQPMPVARPMAASVSDPEAVPIVVTSATPIDAESESLPVVAAENDNEREMRIIKADAQAGSSSAWS